MIYYSVYLMKDKKWKVEGPWSKNTFQIEKKIADVTMTIVYSHNEISLNIKTDRNVDGYLFVVDLSEETKAAYFVPSTIANTIAALADEKDGFTIFETWGCRNE